MDTKYYFDKNNGYHRDIVKKVAMNLISEIPLYTSEDESTKKVTDIDVQKKIEEFKDDETKPGLSSLDQFVQWLMQKLFRPRELPEVKVKEVKADEVKNEETDSGKYESITDKEDEIQKIIEDNLNFALIAQTSGTIPLPKPNNPNSVETLHTLLSDVVEKQWQVAKSPFEDFKRDDQYRIYNACNKPIDNNETNPITKAHKLLEVDLKKTPYSNIKEKSTLFDIFIEGNPDFILKAVQKCLLFQDNNQQHTKLVQELKIEGDELLLPSGARFKLSESFLFCLFKQIIKDDDILECIIKCKYTKQNKVKLKEIQENLNKYLPIEMLTSEIETKALAETLKEEPNITRAELLSKIINADIMPVHKKNLLEGYGCKLELEGVTMGDRAYHWQETLDGKRIYWKNGGTFSPPSTLLTTTLSMAIETLNQEGGEVTPEKMGDLDKMLQKITSSQGLSTKPDSVTGIGIRDIPKDILKDIFNEPDLQNKEEWRKSFGQYAERRADAVGMYTSKYNKEAIYGGEPGSNKQLISPLPSPTSKETMMPSARRI